jgi:catechol 2,3-dioxygenase-like lactoylglutathione lyase family enzyme
MTAPQKPVIDCERFHPSLRVPDVSAAVEFYTQKLGFDVGFTWGTPISMAGVNLGKVQVFIETGTPAPQGAAVYFVVGNADALHDYHKASGVTVTEPPGDPRTST